MIEDLKLSARIAELTKENNELKNTIVKLEKEAWDRYYTIKSLENINTHMNDLFIKTIKVVKCECI